MFNEPKTLLSELEINFRRPWNYLVQCNKTTGISWADAITTRAITCRLEVDNLVMVRWRLFAHASLYLESTTVCARGAASNCFQWMLDLILGLQPNGVAKDSTGKHLYVASTLKLEFLIYRINEDGHLKLRTSVRLPSLCDNIDVDPTGATPLTLLSVSHSLSVSLSHSYSPRLLLPHTCCAEELCCCRSRLAGFTASYYA
jgi:hypothetical protein